MAIRVTLIEGVFRSFLIIKMDDDILIKFATLDSYLSSKNVSFQDIHCPIHNIDKNKPRAPIRDVTKKW